MRQANRPYKPKTLAAKRRHEGLRVKHQYDNIIISDRVKFDEQVTTGPRGGKLHHENWRDMEPKEWVAEWVIHLLRNHPFIMEYIREWAPEVLQPPE